MSKKKLNTEQINWVLKQVEAGRTATEMAREIGVSKPGSRSTAAWK